MESRFTEIRDVFGKPGAKFRVPDYEGRYEWGEAEFEELWEDLQRIGDDVDTHYLGKIVLLERDEEGPEEVYHIVDGYQRLVTLSVLVMAIRDAQGIDNDDDKTTDTVLNTYVSGSAERKLELYDDDQDAAFAALWAGRTTGVEGKVGDAYEFYRTRVSRLDEDELEELKTDVANLKTVEMTELPVAQTLKRWVNVILGLIKR